MTSRSLSDEFAQARWSLAARPGTSSASAPARRHPLSCRTAQRIRIHALHTFSTSCAGPMWVYARARWAWASGGSSSSNPGRVAQPIREHVRLSAFPTCSRAASSSRSCSPAHVGPASWLRALIAQYNVPGRHIVLLLGFMTVNRHPAVVILPPHGDRPRAPSGGQEIATCRNN